MCFLPLYKLLHHVIYLFALYLSYLLHVLVRITYTSFFLFFSFLLYVAQRKSRMYIYLSFYYFFFLSSLGIFYTFSLMYSGIFLFYSWLTSFVFSFFLLCSWYNYIVNVWKMKLLFWPSVSRIDWSVNTAFPTFILRLSRLPYSIRLLSPSHRSLPPCLFFSCCEYKKEWVLMNKERVINIVNRKP